ncbi:MAG: AAA family ATPase [Deltaproteobacteria bacterium HGW-Deltaproteobacteria-14]|jgi:predicted HTH transcriptional regulator|nr:MAG: AAA family ATPase [Deltaproteobacteria bacterium HGW-Deltaproteobacteria-14]
MAMTLEELSILREGWDFEAKAAQGRDGTGAVPRSFWETYAAMANGEGGLVALGVRERGDHGLEVLGLDDPERVQKDLWDTLDNRQKVSANVLTRADVSVEALAGLRFLLVRVPRAERRSRPVYINDDLWSGTFVRVHEGDRHADRDRVRRMVAESTQDSRDDRVLQGFAIGDLSRETVAAYRNVFRSTKPAHPWLPLDDEAFLTKVGAIGADRESGRHGLTLAGLLMFGGYEAIRAELPHFFLDYQERGEDEGAIAWVDRIYPDGTWSGNLYDFFRRAIVKLAADVKVPFALAGGVQRRDDTHVHEALREGLVNALIHADWEATTSLLAVKRPDGFTFRNPGTPRLSLAQIREGGISDCRNRTLQRMFLLIGIGETAGSGFSRILRAWREQSWRAPALRVSEDPEITTLELTTASLLPDGVVARLSQRFGQGFESLGADERVAVVTAAAEGRVTNQRLRDLVALHARDATVLLRRLVDAGLLGKHGERSDAWYSVAGEARALPLFEGAGDGGTSVDSDATSDDSDATSAASDATSDDSDATSAASDATSQGDTAVARVRASGRVRSEILDAAILAVCRGRFLTREDVAAGVGRAVNSLRARNLPRLVREGRLELRYPERPNHPRQAYRTVDRGQEAPT